MRRLPGAFRPATRATPAAARATWMMSLSQSFPRVSPTPRALAMSDPMRAATMPIAMVSQIEMS